jgi:hypothetical protein
LTLENTKLKDELQKAREEIQRLRKVVYDYESATTTPFPLMRLPLEIRRMIWRLCLPPQRTLHAIATERGQFYDKSFTFVRLPPPIITRVCSKSRNLAFETGGFILKLGAVSPDLAAVDPWHLSWFDYVNDVLHLDSCVVQSLMPTRHYSGLLDWCYLKHLQQRVEQNSFHMDCVRSGCAFGDCGLLTWPRLRNIFTIMDEPVDIRTIPRSALDCALFGHCAEQSNWTILHQGDIQRMERVSNMCTDASLLDAEMLVHCRISSLDEKNIGYKRQIERDWFRRYRNNKKETDPGQLRRMEAASQIVNDRQFWLKDKDQYSSTAQELSAEMPNVVLAAAFRKCKL